MKREKILLVHLNSRGDCLYSTVIARQIKELDFKDCYLTWAISSKCKEVIMLNPYVDEVWEIPTAQSLANDVEWEDFVKQAEQYKKKGQFDIIFYTQVIGKNMINFDGGIRSSTYNNYPKEITVSHTPVIRLSDIEVNNVKTFAERNHFNKYKNILLIECGPESFKSNLNFQSSLELANKIVSIQKDTAVILSSNKKIESENSAIIDGSTLSFRENAELTKYCTLFLGCSSGISWLTTTDWAKPLPKIILTDYTTRVCSSMIHDHEYLGIPTEEIIEFQEADSVLEKIDDCINIILTESFKIAKDKYRAPAKLKNYSFVYRGMRESFKQGKFAEAIEVFKRCNKRNGFHFMALPYVLKAYFKMPFYLIQRGIKMSTSTRKN